MKPTNVCLSKSEISALLSSDLLPNETASAEQHIAECETCRTTIESMIADSRWWNDAQESLAAFSSRARSEADVSHETAPASTEQMLSLLGPTDDPEKLGRIAECEVIGIIGRGGMGVVFKAFDPRLNRFVAIKMLLPHLAASGAARKRFAREGQAAAAVVDDYVLPIYAVSEWKGVPYLVTQLSRGTTLQKRVQSEGPLEVKEILRLGMQTARGLAAAHAQGLVHRDVKPSNILLDGSVERAMLTDFGLARAVDDASITRTGVIAGTPQYMSPEQARGGSVDARSDLFSLGCVLYFLCTGHPPFRADNSYAILRLITDEEPRSIREVNPDIPAWLCSIVQKLMAKTVEDRYTTAGEVADVLEACLAHVSNPLKNPLPDEPEALAEFAFSKPPSTSRLGNRLAPQAQDRVAGASHSFLRFLWTTFMNDKRILSLVAFGLFIGAFLLPWPIAAIGRDEHPVIFAGVSVLLALTFAAMSRRESFSRIVLVTLGGMIGLFVVGFTASVPIYIWRNNQAANEARLLEQTRVDELKRAAEEAGIEKQQSAVEKYELRLADPPSSSGPHFTTDESLNGKAETVVSETRQTLAESVKAFNEQSAKDRRTLFNPPIPDMTEEQLRQGFADAAKEYRDGGESHIADTLEKISETGVISTDGSIGVVLAGGISSIFQKDGTRHKDGKPETKQIAPALVLPDGTGGHKYVVLRPLELIYSHNGQSSKSYGDLYPNNEHSPKTTITVQIPIECSKHPVEMMERNLNYQGLSLLAAGVMVQVVESGVRGPARVIVAHHCTLRAFDEVERDGEKFWNTTLVVPMQNELLDLRPGMTLEEAEAKFDPKAFQGRLDKWREDGAKFELDHYLGQEPKGVPIPTAATGSLPVPDRLSSASRLVTTIPGLDYLKSDLKALLDLTTETEQRQWGNVQGYLDTVFDGVEKTRPMEIQHVPSIGDGAMLLWIPLPEGDNSFKVFRANLESLGYILRQEEHDAESVLLYRMIQQPEHGWIRIDLEEKLACIALTESVEAMDALRGQILAAKPVANPADCSLAIAMTNADHSAEAQEYRRRAFQSYRDQTIKNMTAKGKGLLPAQLNDWLTTTWLDEYQLLSAEGSKISARVVLDRSKPAQANAEMTFAASAISNTALAASLSQLASSHDAYATWPMGESSILSLRVNAPVSQLRQDKLQSLNNWFVTELRKSLISLNEQNDTSKDAADQLATGCRQILSDVILSGRCNAIIDSSLVDGQLQWIGSMVIPKPQLMTELLPLLTQLQPETAVELNVRKVGNVDFHRVKFAGRLQELLQSILQSDGQYYFGCDADKIWFACGPDALDSLAARIETLGPSQPRADVFRLNVRFGTLVAPLIRVCEQRSQESGPVDPDQQQSQRRLLQLLRDLKDSTTNEDDSLSVYVHTSDDALNATIKCDTGILRFFGKQIARFSKVNLQ